jgi:hypothetical protein
MFFIRALQLPHWSPLPLISLWIVTPPQYDEQPMANKLPKTAKGVQITSTTSSGHQRQIAVSLTNVMNNPVTATDMKQIIKTLFSLGFSMASVVKAARRPDARLPPVIRTTSSPSMAQMYSGGSLGVNRTAIATNSRPNQSMEK